ncbi:MAG: tripartite tricarboxylate transporter TctB family protein [Candidatus Competibacterales bacterium]
MQLSHRWGERLFALALCLFSLFCLYSAHGIAGLSALSSPGAFPLMVSAVMVVATLRLVLVPSPGVPPPAEKPPRVGGRVVGFLLLLGGFAILLQPLGFLLATPLFLFSAILWLQRCSIAFASTITLAALVVVYGLFRLLFEVVLPEGIVPEGVILARLEALWASLWRGLRG